MSVEIDGNELKTTFQNETIEGGEEKESILLQTQTVQSIVLPNLEEIQQALPIPQLEHQHILLQQSQLPSLHQYSESDKANELRAYIEYILADTDDGGRIPTLNEKPLKSRRPENWRAIAEHASNYGNYAAMKLFPEVCLDNMGERCKSQTIDVRLARWAEDYRKELANNEPMVLENGGRKPPYGKEIDQRLSEAALQRVESGQRVDAVIIRDMLMVELEKHSMSHLLKENGGDCVFGPAWANRFFHRHSITPSVSFANRGANRTDVPPDFEKKLENFDNVLAYHIDVHNIPPGLVLNMNETVCIFVPAATKKRVRKGAKKLKFIGIAKDKAQITVSICVNELGHVLPPQLIFSGKTARCYPKCPPPHNGTYSFSKSHWQTPETFMNWISHVLLPYKEEFIQLNSLPSHQKMLLIMDLHSSHRPVEIISYLHSLNIIPVFIPLGCNALCQVTELACDRPFKSTIKRCFKELVLDQLNQHIASGTSDPSDFKVNLTMRSMKPYISDFVGRGLDTLKSEEMRDYISRMFAESGRLMGVRSPERAALARQLTNIEELEMSLLEGGENYDKTHGSGGHGEAVGGIGGGGEYGEDEEEDEDGEEEGDEDGDDDEDEDEEGTGKKKKKRKSVSKATPAKKTKGKTTSTSSSQSAVSPQSYSPLPHYTQLQHQLLSNSAQSVSSSTTSPSGLPVMMMTSLQQQHQQQQLQHQLHLSQLHHHQQQQQQQQLQHHLHSHLQQQQLQHSQTPPGYSDHYHTQLQPPGSVLSFPHPDVASPSSSPSSISLSDLASMHTLSSLPTTSSHSLSPSSDTSPSSSSSSSSLNDLVLLGMGGVGVGVGGMGLAMGLGSGGGLSDLVYQSSNSYLPHTLHPPSLATQLPPDDDDSEDEED